MGNRIQLRGGGLDLCDTGGHEKWSDSEYILKVELTEFAAELYVTNGKAKGVKDDSQLFCPEQHDIVMLSRNTMLTSKVHCIRLTSSSTELVRT